MLADTRRESAVAPVIREFMRCYRMPPESLRHDGRLTLRVARRSAIEIVPAPHGRFAIQSQLIALQDHPESITSAALLHVAQVMAGMMQDHASAVCIDPRAGALVLQQTIQADSQLRALQDAVGNFVNALAFWSRYCSTSAGLSRGRP